MSLFKFVLGLGLTIGVAIAGRADTIFLKDAPTSNVLTTDAASASKEPVLKCEKVHRGPNINPVKVAGSKTIWVSKVDGAGEQDVAALLGGGKSAYRCKTMALDSATGRMKSAN